MAGRRINTTSQFPASVPAAVSVARLSARGLDSSLGRASDFVIGIRSRVRFTWLERREYFPLHS